MKGSRMSTTLSKPHFRVMANGEIKLEEGEGFDLMSDMTTGGVLQLRFGGAHVPVVVVTTELSFRKTVQWLATRGDITHRLLVGNEIEDGGESLGWSRGPSKLYIGVPWFIYRDRMKFANVEEECAFIQTPPITGLSYLW